MTNPLPLPATEESVATRSPVFLLSAGRLGRTEGRYRGGHHDSSGRGAAARPLARRGAVAPGPGPDGRRIRGRRQDPGPSPQPPRAGPVRGDVERALLVQVVPVASTAPAHRGSPGPRRSRRERGGHRRRGRHRGGHPHREPQPSVGHRALPGRRHRRGRDPARHLHHGRAPARRHGSPLLRTARGRPATLARRGRGERHLGLRQLGRRPDGGRRADLRPLLHPEPARQRAVHGRAARRAPRARHRVGPGQPGGAARVEHRTGRHRRRQRPRLGRLQRRRRGSGRRHQAPQCAGR